MCWCTPEIRTPYCGKPGCEPPENFVPPKPGEGVGITVRATLPCFFTFISATAGLNLKAFRLALQRAQDHLDEHDAEKADEWERLDVQHLAGHLLGHAKLLQFTLLARTEAQLREGGEAVELLERHAAAAVCRALMMLERVRRLRTRNEEPR